jgi:2-dehydro-3-deoxygalactonokinase
MMIVGDWGSTAMRLNLCATDNGNIHVIDRAAGPGVKFCTDFESAFFASTESWLDTHGVMPVVLAGMIGSNLGWADCPYAQCPTDASALTGRMHRFTVRGVEIAIAPGLRCTNIFGLPDVMRGEEVQLFGLLELLGNPRGRMLVCLPGTHAKWAIVEDGVVRSFFTSMQGELFEVLLAHSLVGRGLPDVTASAPVTPLASAFRDGVARMLADPTLAVELAVFAARSRVVTGDLPATEARAFLSGLLIAAEVRDAIAAHAARDMVFDAVTLVGAEALMPLYAAPIEALGLKAHQVPAHDASIRGLGALAGADPLVVRS